MTIKRRDAKIVLIAFDDVMVIAKHLAPFSLLDFDGVDRSRIVGIDLVGLSSLLAGFGGRIVLGDSIQSDIERPYDRVNDALYFPLCSKVSVNYPVRSQKHDVYLCVAQQNELVALEFELEQGWYI